MITTDQNKPKLVHLGKLHSELILIGIWKTRDIRGYYGLIGLETGGMMKGYRNHPKADFAYQKDGLFHGQFLIVN